MYIFDYVGTCAHSYPTLRDPMDCNPPGSSVHGISYANMLEQVAISYSRESSRPKDGTRFSRISCTRQADFYHYTTWEAPYSRENTYNVQWYNYFFKLEVIFYTPY